MVSPQRDRGTSPDRQLRFDRTLGALALLPVLALVLPWPGPGALGGPALATDPTPEFAAAGWTALAALPALALLVALRRGLGSPWLLLLLAAQLGALLRAHLGARCTDTLGADRAAVALAAATALATVGAGLGPAGRRTFAFGGALLGALALLQERLGGVPVGNSGDLSELALPAGIAGLALFLHGPRALGWLGLAAAFGHALYAGLQPVHAGTLGWLVAAAAGFLAARGRREARRLARLALLAAFVAVAASGARTAWAAWQPRGAAQVAPTQASSTPDRPPGPDPAELGGVGFRLATWRATAALVAATPFGVGAGQFQAAFPPYRDQRELVASSHERREPTPQEVEHPHHDALLALAELGLAAGGALVLFCVVAGLSALRRVGGADGVQAGLGMAAVALLTVSCLNTPLLQGTASAALGWVLLGAVLPTTADGVRGSAARAGRTGPLALLLVGLGLAVQAPTAWSLVEHGRALSALPAARVVVDGREEVDAEQLGRILGRALAVRPDSVVALEKRAELMLARGAPAAERRLTLERVLELRPHTFSARLSVGNLLAAEGDLEGAEAAFARAAAVDPTHPALLSNRLTLALDRRDVAGAEAALAALRREGLAPDAELVRRAAEQLLRGRLEVADVVLRTWAPRTGLEPDAVRYDPLDPNDAYRAQKALRERGEDLLADGFLCAYQLHMAREHRRDGLYEQAVRMARLALRRAEAYPGLPGAHGALRLELALAQLGAGDLPAAEATLGAGPVAAVDLRRLPEGDRDLLQAGGFVSLQGGRLVVPQR